MQTWVKWRLEHQRVQKARSWLYQLCAPPGLIASPAPPARFSFSNISFNWLLTLLLPSKDFPPLPFCFHFKNRREHLEFKNSVFVRVCVHTYCNSTYCCHFYFFFPVLQWHQTHWMTWITAKCFDFASTWETKVWLRRGACTCCRTVIVVGAQSLAPSAANERQ